MKRIIALFVVMLAFGFSANAQEKKAVAPAAKQVTANKDAAYSEAAIKDVATLSEYVKLTADQKVTLKSLFQEKHQTNGNNKLSAERKAILAESIEAKLKSTLEPAQLAKIQGNTQLMNVLTH